MFMGPATYSIYLDGLCEATQVTMRDAESTERQDKVKVLQAGLEEVTRVEEMGHGILG